MTEPNQPRRHGLPAAVARALAVRSPWLWLLVGLLLVGSRLVEAWRGAPEWAPPAGSSVTTSHRDWSNLPLQEIAPAVYRSPAGLIFGPGSLQGHRLDHVLAHGRDQPDRPGEHGVFADGDPQSVVALLDEAYELARQGRRTQRRLDQSRTIYTVDLGRPIGYLGGQAGQRRGHPTARHLRLVLEAEQVITAYPVIP